MLRRMWNTMNPPRPITAITATIYLLTLTLAVMVPYARPPIPTTEWFAAAFILAGSLAGIPAVWRGMYWLEGPCAVAVTTGMGLEAFVDITQRWPIVHMPLRTTVLVLIIGAFFTARAWRVWHHQYAPGAQHKETPQESQAKRALEAEKQARQLLATD